MKKYLFPMVITVLFFVFCFVGYVHMGYFSSVTAKIIMAVILLQIIVVWFIPYHFSKYDSKNEYEFVNTAEAKVTISKLKSTTKNERLIIF